MPILSVQYWVPKVVKINCLWAMNRNLEFAPEGKFVNLKFKTKVFANVRSKVGLSFQ